MSAVPPVETVPNRDLTQAKARFANAGRIFADDQNVVQDGQISTLQSRAGVIESNLSNEISVARSSEAKALVDAKSYTDAQLSSLLGANVSGALSQLQNFAYEISQTPTGNLLNELSDINRGISAEKAFRIAGDLSLETALSSEVVRAVSAENFLSSGLTQENNRAVSTENSLTSSLSREKSIAREAENSLETNLSVEVRNRSIAVSTELSRATSAESSLATSLSVNISTELARATSAELSLQTRFVDANGALSVRITGVESTAASSLSSAISTEIRDRSTAIQGAIATEVTARNAAINAESSSLKTYADSAVATEVTNRTIAVSNLSTSFSGSLSSEISRALAIESSLQGRLVADVSTELRRATSTETSLQTNISTELSRAVSAEASLQALISTGNGSLDSFKAATSTNFGAVTQAFNVIFGAIDIEKYVGSTPNYFAYSAGITQTLSAPAGSPAGSPAGAGSSAPATAPAPPDYSTGSWTAGDLTYTARGFGGVGTTKTVTMPISGFVYNRTGTLGEPVLTGLPFTFNSPVFTLAGSSFVYKLAVGGVAGAASASPSTTPSATGNVIFQLQAYDGATTAATITFNALVNAN